MQPALRPIIKMSAGAPIYFGYSNKDATAEVILDMADPMTRKPSDNFIISVLKA